MRKKVSKVTKTGGRKREVLSPEQRKHIREMQRRLPGNPNSQAACARSSS